MNAIETDHPPPAAGCGHGAARPLAGGRTLLEKDATLVSVGMPTFNNAASLGTAVRSVLQQDYPAIELLIADNASSDETETFCRSLELRVPRVVYIRQPLNRGPIENLREVLQRSQGQLFMWLGDDDWLSASYIRRCVETLISLPDYALVCGTVRYYRDGEFAYTAARLHLEQASPDERILSYYGNVTDNGIFYGLSRREDLLRCPLVRRLGTDWHVVAGLSFFGKVRVLDDVFLNRNLGGTSRSYGRIVASLGISAIHGWLPFASIASSAFWQIAVSSPSYRSVGRAHRLGLGARAALTVLSRGDSPDLDNVHRIVVDARCRALLAAQRIVPPRLYAWARRFFRSGGRRA